MPCPLPTKKELLLFDCTMNNSTLEHIKSYPYLEVTLADSFLWSDHVHIVNCKAKANALYVLFGVTSVAVNRIKKRSPMLALSAHSLNMPARYGTRTTKVKSMTLRWSSIMQHASYVEFITTKWVLYQVSCSNSTGQLIKNIKSCMTHSTIQNSQLTRHS